MKATSCRTDCVTRPQEPPPPPATRPVPLSSRRVECTTTADMKSAVDEIYSREMCTDTMAKTAVLSSQWKARRGADDALEVNVTPRGGGRAQAGPGRAP